MPANERVAGARAVPAPGSPPHAVTHAALHLLVLGSLPLILLAIDRDWMYSADGLIDPWLYHGYFHRYPEFVSSLYPGTYYGTRLAWILPGYAAYHLLTPHAANAVLHLSFYYVAILALYRIGAVLSNPGAALISAAAFGTAMPTIVALGWDYIDGAVITYTLVSIWAVVESGARRRRAPLLFVSGVSAACIVHSNLAAVLLGLPISLAYWGTHQRRRWSDVGWFVSGGLAVTLVFGLIDVAAGGPFFFFMGSVEWASASLGTQTFTPVPPLRWPGSSRFIIPLIGICAAVGAILARRTPATRMVTAMLASLLAAFLAYDGLLSGGMLQIQYYVSWFLPLAFIALSVALAPIALTDAAAATLALAIAVGQGLAFRVGTAFGALLAAGGGGAGADVVFVAVSLAVVAVMAWRGRRSAHAVVLATALVVADLIATPNLGYGPSPYGRSQFDAVQQTLAFIRVHIPRGSKPWFWIQPASANSPYYASLASTHLYLYSLISVSYPTLRGDLPPPPGNPLAVGDYIIIAADRRADRHQIEEELRELRLGVRMLAWAPIHTDDADFALTLFQVSR